MSRSGAPNTRKTELLERDWRRATKMIGGGGGGGAKKEGGGGGGGG